MKTALWPLQQALYDRLKNDTTLITRADVLDDVPKGTPMPYVTLGEETVNDYSSKTFDGEDATHTLHVWSDYNGKKEAKEILDLVLQSITANPLVIPGFTLEGIQREFMEVFNDGGGVYHGVMRLRFYIKQ
jgi:hypothetical protein